MLYAAEAKKGEAGRPPKVDEPFSGVFFIQKSIYNELLSAKNYPGNDLDWLYSKLKEAIKYHRNPITLDYHPEFDNPKGLIGFLGP